MYLLFDPTKRVDIICVRLVMGLCINQSKRAHLEQLRVWFEKNQKQKKKTVELFSNVQGNTFDIAESSIFE